MLRLEHGKIVSLWLKRKDENDKKTKVPIGNKFKNLFDAQTNVVTPGPKIGCCSPGFPIVGGAWCPPQS